MDKKTVFITIAALITLNLSCTNKNGEKQKQLISEVDSVTLRDSIEDTDTSYLSIYKKELENGQYRDFYITRGEDGYIFRAYDSASKQYHNIDFNADDYMNGGVSGITGFASPDGRYVYVVGDILANSTGWICTLLIYQVDTKTLKAKLVNGVAAWRLDVHSSFLIQQLAQVSGSREGFDTTCALIGSLTGGLTWLHTGSNCILRNLKSSARIVPRHAKSVVLHTCRGVVTIDVVVLHTPALEVEESLSSEVRLKAAPVVNTVHVGNSLG